MRRTVALLALGVLVLSGLSGCAAIRANEARTAGRLLQDAGFRMRAAETPEQLAELRSVPPRRLVPREHDGQRFYVYADPDVCRCVYVGNERSYLIHTREMLRTAELQINAPTYLGAYAPRPLYP